MTPAEVIAIVEIGAEVTAAVADVVRAAIKSAEPPTTTELLDQIKTAIKGHQVEWIEKAKAAADAAFENAILDD